jgi:mutator protein MutT
MTQAVSYTDLAFATANGIDIAYDTFGSASDPPLLLIMGLGVQMILWDENFCRQLAARGYRVIRFDNRDVGLSTSFTGAGVPNIPAVLEAQSRGVALEVPYTLADMANDAMGVLDALAIASAHVVGLSMGGMIGQVMALRFPERVRSLTSIMSTTGDPELPPPKPEALAVLVSPIPAERSAYVEGWLTVWRVLSGPQTPIEEALARKWAELSHDRGLNPHGFLRQMAAVIASGSRKDALKSLTVPTLVLHGDADPLVPLECGIDTANSIPGAKLHIIEGMGHALPKALWPQVIDAIAGHALERLRGPEQLEGNGEGVAPNRVHHCAVVTSIACGQQPKSEVRDMQTVTAAILIRGDKVFIGQRKAGKRMAHMWEFPGGKLEDGETLQECLAREMQEELGVQVVVREFFGESVYDHEHGTIRLLAYFVDWTGGEMSPMEHQDCKWVPFDDLENYEFVPADRPLVQKLRSTFQVRPPHTEKGSESA